MEPEFSVSISCARQSTAAFAIGQLHMTTYADARGVFYNALRVRWLHAAGHDAWRYNSIRRLTSWHLASHFRVLKVVRVVRSRTNRDTVGERSLKWNALVSTAEVSYEEKTHGGM